MQPQHRNGQRQIYDNFGRKNSADVAVVGRDHRMTLVHRPLLPRNMLFCCFGRNIFMACRRHAPSLFTSCNAHRPSRPTKLPLLSRPFVGKLWPPANCKLYLIKAAFRIQTETQLLFIRFKNRQHRQSQKETFNWIFN